MSKKDELSLNQGKRNEIPSMWEKTKCASSLKNLKFIMQRRVEGSSKRKFNKKGRDTSSIERCKCIKARKKSRECIKWLKIIKLRNIRGAKGPQKFIQSRDERPKKKKKRPKKRKEAH